MKKSALSFAALIAAAALLLTLGGAYLMRAADSFRLSGEVLLGSRGDAGDFGAQVSMVTHSLYSDCRWSAQDGSAETSARWVTGRQSDFGEPALMAGGVGMSLTVYRKSAGAASDELARVPYLESCFQELAARPAGESPVMICELDGHTDRVPVMLGSNCLEDTVTGTSAGYYTLADVFAVPAPEGQQLTVTLERSWNGYYIFRAYSELLNLRAASSSAWDGETLYFALSVTDENNEAADASLVPGGSWGVYRIDCKSRTERGMLTARTDFSSVENILPGGAWKNVKLELGQDGTLLCFVQDFDDSVRLLVLDKSGGLRQEVEVFPAGSAESLEYAFELRQYASGAVAVLNDTSARELVYDGGSYTPGVLTDVYPHEFIVAGVEGEDYHWRSVDFLARDGRVAALWRVQDFSEGWETETVWHLLTVSGPEGMVYAEKLSDNVQSGYNAYGYHFEAELAAG